MTFAGKIAKTSDTEQGEIDAPYRQNCWTTTGGNIIPTKKPVSFSKRESASLRIWLRVVFIKMRQRERNVIIKTVHGCPLTSKFLVHPSNAECGGLETAYKDSRQMFQHSDRINFRANLSNFIQDLFWSVRFSNEDFKMVEDGLASLAIVKI